MSSGQVRLVQERLWLKVWGVKCLPVCNTALHRVLSGPFWFAQAELGGQQCSPKGQAKSTCWQRPPQVRKGAMMSPGKWRIANVTSHGHSESSAWQSQEPSWIMEPLNSFFSELCQTLVGSPSNPQTQRQIVPILLSSQRAQHKDRNGGKAEEGVKIEGREKT